MNSQKVWFVTGASKGLGLQLTKKLLTRGYKVAATSRTVGQLKKAVNHESDDFLPLSMDLEDEQSIQRALTQTIEQLGGLDVIVNNAGYGLAGSLEELTDAETRQNFDVNVFGTLNVIRQAMPYLRKQQAGHIFNISSIGGLVGDFPGFGVYCGTKFALAGITEALAADVRAFGIKVTGVFPGYFRTNFLSTGSLITPNNEIEAYREVRASQQQHQHQINGHQQGDPDKAAEVLIHMAEEAEPPLHLFLGQDAYELAKNKLTALKEELEQWKEFTVSTSFEAVV